MGRLILCSLGLHKWDHWRELRGKYQGHHQRCKRCPAHFVSLDAVWRFYRVIKLIPVLR